MLLTKCRLAIASDSGHTEIRRDKNITSWPKRSMPTDACTEFHGVAVNTTSPLCSLLHPGTVGPVTFGSVHLCDVTRLFASADLSKKPTRQALTTMQKPTINRACSTLRALTRPSWGAISQTRLAQFTVRTCNPLLAQDSRATHSPDDNLPSA